MSKLLCALFTGNLKLLSGAVSTDFIAERRRFEMIPYYVGLKKLAIREDALGVNICDVGPLIFSLHESCEEAVAGVAAWWRD
ncbi:MAG: hypothetical protein QW360_02795 [Thermofilum sp.]